MLSAVGLGAGSPCVRKQWNSPSLMLGAGTSSPPAGIPVVGCGVTAGAGLLLAPQPIVADALPVPDGFHHSNSATL